MKIIRICAPLAAAAVLLTACAGAPPATPTAAAAAAPASAAASTTTGRSTYFGWVQGATDPTAVAFDVDPADAQGNRAVRAYVCDGLGQGVGKALWFKGTVNAAQTAGADTSVGLTATGSPETLVIDSFHDRVVIGSFGGAAGARQHYVLYPAFDGAGIYDVTVAADRGFTGKSTDGSTLTGSTDPNGISTFSITTADGTVIPGVNRSLSSLSADQLQGQGLSAAYRQFSAVNQVPDSYIAVIAPSGTHWLGRSGDVRKGSPGNNIIGLGADARE